MPRLSIVALTGYEDTVAETGRLTEQRRELDAQELAEINRRLCFLFAHLKDQPEVTIEYFVPDERKAGGSYQTVVGKVRIVSAPEQKITLRNGMVIRMEGIVSLAGTLFEKMEK